jgi:type VI secretion system activator RovC-like protein
MPLIETRGATVGSILRTGGCDFPIDPSLSAPDASVFWRPDAAPAVACVMHAAAPSSPSAFSLETLPVLDRRQAEDGLWLRLTTGQAQLLGASAAPTGLALLLPFDDHLPVRTALAHRLWQSLQRRPPAEPPLAPQRRWRIARALRAHDARAMGVSSKAMAQVVFGAPRVAAEHWKTSALKAATVRLVASGRKWVAGAYRALLTGRALVD